MNVHQHAAQIATDALREIELKANTRLPLDQYTHYEEVITTAALKTLNLFKDYDNLEVEISRLDSMLGDARKDAKEAETKVSELEEKLKNAEKEAESRISALEKKLEKAEKALNTLVFGGAA